MKYVCFLAVRMAFRCYSCSLTQSASCLTSHIDTRLLLVFIFVFYSLWYSLILCWASEVVSHFETQTQTLATQTQTSHESSCLSLLPAAGIISRCNHTGLFLPLSGNLVKGLREIANPAICPFSLDLSQIITLLIFKIPSTV